MPARATAPRYTSDINARAVLDEAVQTLDNLPAWDLSSNVTLCPLSVHACQLMHAVSQSEFDKMKCEVHTHEVQVGAVDAPDLCSHNNLRVSQAGPCSLLPDLLCTYRLRCCSVCARESMDRGWQLTFGVVHWASTHRVLCILHKTLKKVRLSTTLQSGGLKRVFSVDSSDRPPNSTVHSWRRSLDARLQIRDKASRLPHGTIFFLSFSLSRPRIRGLSFTRGNVTTRTRLREAHVSFCVLSPFTTARACVKKGERQLVRDTAGR